MPIEFRIDPDRRLVSATASGDLTAEEIFKYQHEVWSRPEVKGYNELIDMSNVAKIVAPSHDRLVKLTQLSAHMDDRTAASKFAIVAPDSLAYGLGTIYEAYRNLNPRSTKKVRVFRSMQEAMDWIEEQ